MGHRPASSAKRGAELAFSYQGEALEKARAAARGAVWARTSASSATSRTWRRSTQRSPRSRKRWETLDFVVHAIGFSDKNELRGSYVDTSLDNFLMTMNISAYSLVAVTKRARRDDAAQDRGRGRQDRRRRQRADADLLRCREGRAALQRDGRRQGRARNQRATISPTTSGRRTSGSTRSRPGRSRRLRRAGSATSATSSSGTSSTRRCGATSRSRMSAARGSICSGTCRRA